MLKRLLLLSLFISVENVQASQEEYFSNRQLQITTGYGGAEIYTVRDDSKGILVHWVKCSCWSPENWWHRSFSVHFEGDTNEIFFFENMPLLLPLNTIDQVISPENAGTGYCIYMSPEIIKGNRSEVLNSSKSIISCKIPDNHRLVCTLGKPKMKPDVRREFLELMSEKMEQEVANFNLYVEAEKILSQREDYLDDLDLRYAEGNFLRNRRITRDFMEQQAENEHSYAQSTVIPQFRLSSPSTEPLPICWNESDDEFC